MREAVEAEYREALKAASFWGRLVLKRKLEREIRRRVWEKVPPGGLY